MGRRISTLVTMLVVFATAAAACAGASSTTSLDGRITDARTGAALTDVAVRAGRLSTTSKRDGTFKFMDVPKKATVTIHLANYQDLSRLATRKFSNVRLAPLPVHGELRSGLSLQPLAGTVTVGGKTSKAAADGTFVVYGVGPAGTVTGTADGYMPGTGKVDADRKVLVIAVATPATALAFDAPAIKQLWRGNSDSWGAGGPAGATADADYVNAHNYPGSVPEGIFANCGTSAGSTPNKYSEEYVVDEASIERDDAWTMNFGALKGQKPQGRLYIMKITTSVTTGSAPRLDEAHVAIFNGQVYFFTACK